MVNDSLSDLVSRIKNGYLAGLEVISLPWSRVKEAVLVVLKSSGYIEDFEKKDDELVVKLKYQGKDPAISDIVRVSKPGVRIYSGAKTLDKIARGVGIGIVSTPKGIMSHREAKKLNMGGEVICKVW
jgi:small subunit ribosomal protein S8